MTLPFNGESGAALVADTELPDAYLRVNYTDPKPGDKIFDEDILFREDGKVARWNFIHPYVISTSEVARFLNNRPASIFIAAGQTFSDFGIKAQTLEEKVQELKTNGYKFNKYDHAAVLAIRQDIAERYKPTPENTKGHTEWYRKEGQRLYDKAIQNIKEIEETIKKEYLGGFALTNPEDTRPHNDSGSSAKTQTAFHDAVHAEESWATESEPALAGVSADYDPDEGPGLS